MKQWHEYYCDARMHGLGTTHKIFPKSVLQRNHTVHRIMRVGNKTLQNGWWGYCIISTCALIMICFRFTPTSGHLCRSPIILSIDLEHMHRLTRHDLKDFYYAPRTCYTRTQYTRGHPHMDDGIQHCPEYCQTITSMASVTHCSHPMIHAPSIRSHLLHLTLRGLEEIEKGLVGWQADQLTRS